MPWLSGSGCLSRGRGRGRAALAGGVWSLCRGRGSVQLRALPCVRPCGASVAISAAEVSALPSWYTARSGSAVPSAPAGVINTIAKLAKSCTLRLTASKLYFILSDRVANGGVSMWCELCQVSRGGSALTALRSSACSQVSFTRRCYKSSPYLRRLRPLTPLKAICLAPVPWSSAGLVFVYG